MPADLRPEVQRPALSRTALQDLVRVLQMRSSNGLGGPMVTEQPGAVSVAEDNLGTRVVLVVDDDAAMRETLSDALTAAGYLVETSADGASGLACVQRGRVDLILLDRMLPDIDGRELCRRMRT